MRSGMTLMSVVVAAALAGIVALAVARLLGNQSKVMTVVRLREQRENLLKHYKNIVVSGWDTTRHSCNGEICTRDMNSSGTNVVIPYGDLYLAEDLYDYNYTGGTAGRWWKVTANKISLSGGSVLQADSYAKQETLMAVEVKVEFIRKEHPVVNVKLASREEIVFLHHNTSSALSDNMTKCDSGHRTQKDKDGSALYSGSGVIVQYDFNSNYTKCSQVPLVEGKACAKGAILGFLRTSSTPRLVTGEPICSTTDHTNSLAGIRGGTEKRTVKAIDCSDSGYIERILDDEIPKCVSNPAPGISSPSSMRVAAESKTAPFTDSNTYTLLKRVSGGGGHSDNLATYRRETCTLRRHHGISSFKASGRSGEVAGYVNRTYPYGTQHGPPGLPGSPGRNNAPKGPDGPRGNCSCCCR